MKRLFAAFLLFSLLPGLGKATALDRARLFDWYYPAEPAYQELLKVATAQSRGGWLVREMQAGHSIPQASARELALDFVQSPSTSAKDKQDLKDLFKPESIAAITASADEMGGVGDLEKKFQAMNEHMNELEDTIKKNNYNKQSYPSAGASVNFAYDSNGASGLLAGQNGGTFYGGISVNFNGQADAGSWSFGVGENIDSGGVIGGAVSQHGTMSTASSPNFQMGYSDATMSVNLGGSSNMQSAILALGSVSAPGAPNNFYVNYTGSTNPNYVTSELALGLPAGSAWIPQIFSISKSGSAQYWPFQSAALYFGPDGYGYTASWGSHRIFWGGDLSMDMGSLWGLVDHQLFAAALNGTEGDQDLVQAFTPSPGDTSFSHRSWAVQTDTLTSWAGHLYIDYGQASVLDTNGGYVFKAANNNISSIAGYPGGTITGFQRRYSDDAFVVVYDQPVGLMTFGLEYSKIGPLFEPTHGAVSPSSLTGPNNVFLASDPNASWDSQYTRTPWIHSPSPGGHMENGKVIVDSTRDIAWATNASAATGLMSNTEKIVLQTQFSWSWISLGVYDGIASQIEPTGPWLQTIPTFESGNGGSLLTSRFIPTWLPGAPLPFTAAPSPPATPNYYQWAFDHWADGRAVYDSSGNSIPVHWNQLMSGGGSANYYVLFTKNGVGDARFDDFNQKFINYIALTLKLDVQSLLGSTLPFQIQLYGQSTDVAPAPGLAHFGDPGKPGDPGMIYWDQTNESLFIQYGWSQTLTFIGILRSEDWHSNHSFLPIYITMLEYGAGFDVDANKILTGLGFNFRSRIVKLEDHNIGGRNLSVWDTSVGSSLSF